MDSLLLRHEPSCSNENWAEADLLNRSQVSSGAAADDVYDACLVTESSLLMPAFKPPTRVPRWAAPCFSYNSLAPIHDYGLKAPSKQKATSNKHPPPPIAKPAGAPEILPAPRTIIYRTINQLRRISRRRSRVIGNSSLTPDVGHNVTIRTLDSQNGTILGDFPADFLVDVMRLGD